MRYPSTKVDLSAAHGAAPQGHFDDELGIWIWTRPHSAPTPRPALFLDRDGVIVEDPGYLSRPADLVVLPDAARIVALANRRGIPVVEITNQAGVGRGYYGWPEFVEVEQALAGQLAAGGAALDGVFACPYVEAHPARKPQPGMLLAAARLLNLDLGRSWIVGDKWDDLRAGRNAGLRGGLHVLTGQGAAHRRDVAEWQPPNYNLRLGDSIADAEALLTALE
jgi:D-glycero-D-manno-heptose 1,7-bisphosphate phosphatase